MIGDWVLCIINIQNEYVYGYAYMPFCEMLAHENGLRNFKSQRVAIHFKKIKLSVQKFSVF